jgi:cyclopropane fatty-acyl-phospholipid synthase-like methyltransferase
MVKVPDFDALYEANPDPFHVRSSFYEQRKLGLVLDCLTKPLYAAVWDPACGIGEMAARLAPRAERVLASDASPQAVHLTRRRCSACSNVEVRQLTQPQPPPSEADPFDLIVVSEFAFYLTEQGRQDTLEVLHAAAAENAELVAVHWRHHPQQGYISGEQVQEEVVDHLEPRGWHHVVQHDDRDFIIDVLELADR